MVVERHGPLCVWCSSSYNQKHAILSSYLGGSVHSHTVQISRVMRSSLQTNPNNPRWWITLSVHHVEFHLVVRQDNRTLTRVGPSQQLSDNRSQKCLGRRVFWFLGSNLCFSLLSKSLFLKQLLCSLSFFTFCPPFDFIYCRVLWVAREGRGLPSGVRSEDHPQG